MSIPENDRLDLRQAFADVFGSDRLAEVAMEAMPPLDYDQLATKADVDLLGRELRAETAQLRAELKGEMAELRAELKGDMAELRGEMKGEIGGLRGEMTSNLRLMLAAQLTTMMMLGAWVTAVT